MFLERLSSVFLVRENSVYVPAPGGIVIKIMKIIMIIIIIIMMMMMMIIITMIKSRLFLFPCVFQFRACATLPSADVCIRPNK